MLKFGSDDGFLHLGGSESFQLLSIFLLHVYSVLLKFKPMIGNSNDFHVRREHFRLLDFFTLNLSIFLNLQAL